MLSRFSRVNPRQARDFARAMGVIGKTDELWPKLGDGGLSKAAYRGG